MSDVTRTSISVSEVNTPLLNANIANIGKLALTNVENIQAKQAYIENLTIKELKVLDNDIESGDNTSESFEISSFNAVELNFADNFNCRYTLADKNILESSDGCKLLNINMIIPEELGSKLVCRYFVLDLREEPLDTVVATVWNGADNLRWLHGMPDIQAGFFYVIAFQRFSKDLVIGNISVKIEG